MIRWRIPIHNPNLLENRIVDHEIERGRPGIVDRVSLQLVELPSRDGISRLAIVESEDEIAAGKTGACFIRRIAAIRA